jgi:hypothetical protein
MPFTFNEIQDEFPIEQQLMKKWCWAACTVSIRRFYASDSSFTQQQLAAKLLKIPACVSPKPLPPCNKPFDLGIALDSVGHLLDPVESPLAPNKLAATVQTGRPVGCQMQIPGIGGHAVIVISAKTIGNTLFLRVADPADGSINTMSFSSLRNNYRDLGGRWTRSYFTKPSD